MLKRFRLKSIFLFLLSLVCFVQPVSATEVDVALNRSEDGVYHLKGSFRTHSPPAVIWQVLTDYDRIDDFVGSMRKSEILEKRKNHLFIAQEAIAYVFIFSKKINVLLEVFENPISQINFQDISHKDFNSYKGSWTLESAQNETLVHYNLFAKPNEPLRGLFVKGVFKKTSKELLEDVKKEVESRAMATESSQAPANRESH